MYIKVLQGNIYDSAFVDTGIASQFPAVLPLRPQELGLPSKA